jgi:hypothetical protein
MQEAGWGSVDKEGTGVQGEISSRCDVEELVCEIQVYI